MYKIVLKNGVVRPSRTTALIFELPYTAEKSRLNNWSSLTDFLIWIRTLFRPSHRDYLYNLSLRTGHTVYGSWK